MEFAPQQKKAIAEVKQWLGECRSGVTPRPFFYLAGFAGTGKSTLARHLAELQNRTVVYGAFTGKAAKVMRDNGCDGAQTIHSLIYKPRQDDETGDFKFRWNRHGPCSEAALIVIDECSMVDEKLAKDLLRYKVPVLVLGDPGQLSPVKGAGFFTGHEPDFMLEEIHRQAAESPIIRLATQIRLNEFDYKETDVPGLMITTKKTDLADAVSCAGAIIVGRNNTRKSFNSRMRERLGYGESEFPMPGETLICLRNDRDLGLYNGGIWHVHTVKNPRKRQGETYRQIRIANADDKDIKIDVTVHNSCFDGSEKPFWKKLIGTQEFDFGYVLTGHKSQGSQWDKVVAFDESEVFRDEATRWLYTVCTRAIHNLTLVI